MGSKTAKSTQAITIPPEVLARYNAINARADAVTNRPFQQYTGEFVAPLNATQRAGMANTNAAAGMAQPYFNAATNQLVDAQAATQPYFDTAGQAYGTGLAQGQQYLGSATGYAQAGGQAVNASDLDSAAINKYMSPYLQNVLQGTAGLLNQQNQQQQSGQMGNAIRSGAFGGDRGGIAAANLNQQQNLANAKIFSDILNEGYNNALNTAVGQQAVGLGAAQANRAATQQTADRMAALGQQGFDQFSSTGERVQGLGKDVYGTGAATSAALAGLGTGAQDAALSGAAAQMTAGQVEQATEQADKTARYNQFLQEQSLPYQQLKLASDIALGTGTAQGSTTTTSQPGGFFSDERLKENIKPIGKTFDGQTIHSYNYKGDPRTQIGLIAQEVQKHHPDAVGLAGGYKTVNYDKATEDAADRGHMAYGGLASAGGSVLPQDAGQGFASGGVAGFDPAVMQQLLAAQQAMYAPLMKGDMYAGGPNAGGGLVPQSEFAARQLMTPAELPRVATGVEQANSIASLGKTINEFGEDVGAWGDKDGKKTPPPEDTSLPTDMQTGRTTYESANRRKRADGGGMPYGGQGLDIPTGGLAGAAQPMTAAPLEQRQSGFSKLLGAAGNAASIYGAFKKKAAGGEVPYASEMTGKGLSIPQEDGEPNKYELMTPASLEKPESGLDKVGKIAKIAGTAAMIFSDKRMKENIKAIGKTFDGQTIHSFNYKGDPRTQIGLIAQEVEDHKPHAVGLSGGMKTVDYDKATSGAARRGHFAMGGMSEEEMDDIPSYEPTGLYHGDNKFVRNLFKSTVSGNKNIDLMSGEELPEGPAEDPQQAGPVKMPEPAGLAAAAKEGLPELLTVKKPQAALKPAGLAPTTGALPKNIAQIARLIRAGEGTGQNPESTAKGPYQMIDSTFAGQFRQRYPDRARGMSDQDIIALKRSPEGAALSDEMGPKLIEDNARVIARGGFEPDAGNVYLAHFLGPDTAVKVLRADPNAPIANYVTKEAIRANRPLQENPTAGGVIDWARGAMAKQAARLGRSTGGLAGRNGYAAGGDPDMEFRNFLETGTAPVEEADPAIAAPTGIAPAPTANAAPAAPAPTPPSAGLAAGANDVATSEGPELKSSTTEDTNFFRGLKRGKATSIIPLLSGIAAMGTAPTRSLGVALATGLGAGAQAAQGQRAFGIKQGELGVAKQLADARTAEVTKGILEKRYEFLENGQVYDTYTDTFLPAELATIAKARAFQNGPMDAVAGTTPGAMSRENYLSKNPTAGTVVPQLPAKQSYKPNPNNPSETLLAAAELNEGVMEARANRDRAEFAMNDLYKTLGAPGVGSGRYTQLQNLYTLAKGDYERADAKWKDTLGKVVEVPMAALQGSNAAKIGVNAQSLAPLIEDARTAIEVKQTINEMMDNIKDGSTLTPFAAKIGQALIQSGVDKSLVENFINAPDSTQTQNALAAQLRSYGGDPEASAALKLYGSAQFPAAAVRALLRHAENQADAKIAAFNEGNRAFYNDPLMGNVSQAGIAGQSNSNANANAAMYKSHPAKGSLKAGTPYRVLGDATVHYAK